jgi:hypothetical protein
MGFFYTSDLQQKTSLEAFTPVTKTNKLLVILNIFRTKWLIQFQTWVLPKFTINQNLKILQIKTKFAFRIEIRYWIQWSLAEHIQD